MMPRLFIKTGFFLLAIDISYILIETFLLSGISPLGQHIDGVFWISLASIFCAMNLWIFCQAFRSSSFKKCPRGGKPVMKGEIDCPIHLKQVLYEPIDKRYSFKP